MLQGNLSTSAPVRPFLDWPVVTDPAKWKNIAAAVIGIPYSEPYSGEPLPNDQANAPSAIRLQSGQFCDGPAQWDFDFGGTLGSILPGKGVDAGDCPRWTGSFENYFAATVARLKALFANSGMTFILGGDHGITIPVVHALEVVGKPVHLVQIDAHIDWRDDVRGSRLGYSSPIRRASELPWISGITQIGMRSTGSARAGEVEAARRYGANIITAAEVHAGGIGQVLSHLKGKGPFYLTVDADGLDPSVMPAVLGPAPGGLRFEQVQPIIHQLAEDGPLVGMDVVEVAPSIDLPNKITSLTAGRLILNALGAGLRNRKSEN